MFTGTNFKFYNSAQQPDYTGKQAGEDRRCDVLLVTATDIEQSEALACAEEMNLPCRPFYTSLQTIYDLGRVGGANVSLVQSGKGSGGTRGAQETVSDCITDIHPSAIVLVGIACGLHPQKQHIGEILISEQIRPYELQKITAGPDGGIHIQLRSDRPHASDRLLDRFSSGRRSWQGEPAQEPGLMLSGDKLVNWRDFREQLLQLEPEAIGLEMEGAGLYAAAQRKKVDWIVVKAICDWGENKDYHKASRQQQAAHNAASFVFHVIQQGGLAPVK